MKNETQSPSIFEVESFGDAVMGYSVDDNGQMSMNNYTGDLTVFEYLDKEYKIVKWCKNSKNKGKQFIND